MVVTKTRDGTGQRRDIPSRPLKYGTSRLRDESTAHARGNARAGAGNPGQDGTAPGKYNYYSPFTLGAVVTRTALTRDGTVVLTKTFPVHTMKNDRASAVSNCRILLTTTT